MVLAGGGSRPLRSGARARQDGMALRRHKDEQADERERARCERRFGTEALAEGGPPALWLAHRVPDQRVRLIERTGAVVLVDAQRDAEARRGYRRESVDRVEQMF